MFEPIEPNLDLPKIEQEIIDFWKKNKIFEKSVENRPADKLWNFLDGPPFITGLPHYGTLLPSIAKDLFPRFWTMKGYRVRRVWGWDCHGLPAENKVENKLGIKRKKDIEDVVGVKKFIDECKLYVSTVSKDWEWYIDHIGRWVDFEHAYKTMDVSYMESVMWVFKKMYEKDFIYKGLRVSLYCPHCSTPISNFEVAMDGDNYVTVTEPGTIYKYKLVDEDTYLLAWSTTPWTKLVTTALAINPKLTYVKVKQNGENYILAKATLSILEGDDYKIEKEFPGTELLDKKFEGHFDFFEKDDGKRLFVIVGGDFVTADEGTGAVTLAAYGEDDLNVMKKENVQEAIHLDEEGKFTSKVPFWAGEYYLDANERIDEYLKEKGLIYNSKPYSHTVPTCWRCHTRLIFSPQDAWYVDVQKLKKQMAATNEYVNWFPSHFKHGRFLKSMEAAPDWCISRSRYWGSPVPVWECENGHRFVPGSIKELEEASGTKITDLHKPVVDEVKIPCITCNTKHVTQNTGGTCYMVRVSEVLDSWIEAGSAPYAERHYPFEQNKDLSSFFPPDFIVEYTGQIRAWFYVLHVIANALFESKAFKNVAVTGVILGTDGRKMSKNLGNYPDPKVMLDKYGGDAMRLYLMSTPVMKGEDMAISEEEYKNQIRGTLLPLLNIYNFFSMYATLDDWKPKIVSLKQSELHILDRWILSRVNSLIKSVTECLEKYDTIGTISELKLFVEDWSKWYIRRSRDRVGKMAKEATKNAFYETCYAIFTTFCRISAPIIPFISEYLYKRLTTEESVHLSTWPIADKKLIDSKLEKSMSTARTLVEAGHAYRKKEGLKVRKPLLTIKFAKNEEVTHIEDVIWDIVLDELNCKNIEFERGFHYPKNPIRVSQQVLDEEEKAREVIRQVQIVRKEMGLAPGDIIAATIPKYPASMEEFIKNKILAQSLTKGNMIHIERVK